MGICAVGRILHRAPAIGRRGRADRGGGRRRGREVILISLSVSLGAAPPPSVERGDWFILFGAGGGGIPYNNRMLIFLYFRGCYFCLNKISIYCLV